jgi:FkbH-like protein
MSSILFLSDVIVDPVIKEIKLLSGDQFHIDNHYEEDLVSKLLALEEKEISKYDFIFLHSDQLYHQKEQSWQKTYLQSVSGLSKLFSKNIIVSNSFSLSYRSAPLKLSLGKAFDASIIYNDYFRELTGQANIFFFDFIGICMNVGLNNLYNYNLGHLYQMPYSKQGIKLIASEFVSQIKFLSAEEKKVIVLDCDNTLWKGIIGEDGIDGISCDKNAEGILYHDLQLFLKSKKKEGFLLCLCSKNNEAEVKEAFDKKNMPLQWKDFIIKKINWENKVGNLVEIGKELNVGVDSFIFIDDNLFELNSISELLKGVACIHLSDNYNGLVSIINSFLFRKKQILKEDQEKTGQYELEKLRKDTESAFTSIDDFIESLNINLDIRVNDTADFPRLSQMTGKTNQFNFNKHPYNEDELNSFIRKGRIYSLKVSDKYGDYGTVGLVLLEIDGQAAILENYLMSCRALGKKIEYKFYDHIVGQLSGEGIKIKEIRFISNDKNIPAQTFIKSIENGNKA